MAISTLEALQKRKPVSKDDVFSWVDPQFQADYPNLYDMLTMREYDGKPRSLTKLSIFTNRGCMKVSLCSPSEGVIAYVTVPDFRHLWKHVEAALSSGAVQWQPLKK